MLAILVFFDVIFLYSQCKRDLHVSFILGWESLFETRVSEEENQDVMNQLLGDGPFDFRLGKIYINEETLENQQSKENRALREVLVTIKKTCMKDKSFIGIDLGKNLDLKLSLI